MIEPGTPRDKQWLQECCELVKHKMPENYCFAIFGFPISGTDRIFYASNAQRDSVVAALETWLEHAKGQADLGRHHG